MEGMSLLRVLIESTGLPPEAVEKEIGKLIASKGMNADALTLEDVREILAAYLQEVLTEAKGAYSTP